MKMASASAVTSPSGTAQHAGREDLASLDAVEACFERHVLVQRAWAGGSES